MFDDETLGLILSNKLIKVFGRVWSLNKPRKWDKVSRKCNRFAVWVTELEYTSGIPFNL